MRTTCFASGSQSLFQAVLRLAFCFPQSLISLILMTVKPRIYATIFPSADIAELGKFPFTVMHRGEKREAILIRFQGMVYGYLNQCVHMPKALDCEDGNIFDDTKRYLQCSMHSICYDPVSGVSLSEICAGKKLTAIKVREEDGQIYLMDKRAELIS